MKTAILFISISIVVGFGNFQSKSDSIYVEKKHDLKVDSLFDKWPNNENGNVFRRMRNNGFDFSKVYPIQFFINLKKWPPSKKLVNELTDRFGSIILYEPDGDYGGYLMFQIKKRVIYDFVVNIQREATEISLPYGGICESWRVIQ